jgi:hypothetical protein
MENAVKLLAIGDLLGKDFFIPAYQRGYRWDKQQVVDLLDDLAGFAFKQPKKEGEFYCLQPVVVRPRAADLTALTTNAGSEHYWEVVDGQQRLTTLKILFLYLIRVHLHNESFQKEYKKELFRLHYETRGAINDFLTHLHEGDGSGGSDDNIDCYYIAQAYRYIGDWFGDRDEPRASREKVLQALVGTGRQHQAEGIVQVIWYELAQEENPIDSFTRINLGKIPLTNSELIKALFLQTRNFSSNGDDSGKDLGKLRQLEIATEWDRMENTLQNDDLWWFLNKAENTASARIEFIFDIICQLEREKDGDLAKQIGSDSYATFRFYYQRATGAAAPEFVKQQWAVVVARFNQLMEWYNHPEWYHYVGFLIHCGDQVKDLLALYGAATKAEITTKLKARVAAKLVDKSVGVVQWSRDPAGKAYLSLTYQQPELVRRVLLLFNLREVIRQRNSSLGFARFPFKAFKQEKWDIEHIDSSSERPLTSLDDQREWLTAALHDLPQLSKDLDLLQRVHTYQTELKNELRGDFQDIQQAIVQLAGEVASDAQAKDNIGNLTLLDASTNRSYGNALFVTKRRIIIENDGNGKFIPPCTKNVFLKYFDQQGIFRTSWGADDMQAHRDRIAAELIDFLPPVQPA